MTNDTKQPLNGTVTYVVAPSGTGKSFTGDALMHLHGFHHVDGDYPLKSCGSIERYQSMTKNMIEACVSYSMDKGEDGPEELWKPYFAEIANLTLEALNQNDKSNKVVLSHATYRQAYREHVVKTLVDGGMDRDSIHVVELTIDEEVKLRGLYYRSKRQAEENGMTLGDQMRAMGTWDGEEGTDITVDEYVPTMKKVLGDLNGNNSDGNSFESIPDGFGTIVDVSTRDIRAIEAVEKALGLSPNDRVTAVGSYEELREEIKKFDAERDVDFASSGSQDLVMPWFGEFLAKSGDKKNEEDDEKMIDAADVDEEEKERMKKRRSSMVSAEFLMKELGGPRSSSCSSEGDDKDGSRKSAASATMKARRSSLILTGKI